MTTQPPSARTPRLARWLPFSLAAACLLILAALLVSPSASLAGTPGSASDENEVEFTPTPTASLTSTLTATPGITATLTPSPSISPTLSATPSPTAAASATASPTSWPAPTASETPTLPPPLLPGGQIFLPVILAQPTPTPIPYDPPVRILYCSSINNPIAIPDNKPAGVSHSLQIGETRLLVDLDVYVDITHTWVGDLEVRLRHVETGAAIDLINRPGYPANAHGCGSDDIGAILDDELTLPVESRCITSPTGVGGVFIPQEPLSTFDGESLAGTWTLKAADLSQYDTGKLNRWCLAASVSANPAPPTPTPTPPSLPASAHVGGVTGQKQALPLDCESRVAVDWAKFFGFSINELNFFNQLPKSKNPDKGFVGSVYGAWGQIPPNDYGVHAEPVASLLRAYGVTAYAHRPLSWDRLRAEIAADRPVYVWITGSTTNGEPVYFVPPDELFTIVARYEHTVMVTGYTSSNVTILDGGTQYTRSLAQFLESWSALGNMAIIATP